MRTAYHLLRIFSICYYLCITFLLVVDVVYGDNNPLFSTTEGKKDNIHSTENNKIDNEHDVKIRMIDSGQKTVLQCPPKRRNGLRPFLLSLSCQSTKDCSILGPNLLCCDGKCVKGAKVPITEPHHSRAFFGLIERNCPTDPVPELLAITPCTADVDCGPRICCPEREINGTPTAFCRTPQAKFDDRLPAPARRLTEPLKLIMAYMQCTPPPPPVLDLFPKVCNNSLDCFPNLCCQERGKRYCRPPKRSLFTLLITITQRLIPDDAVRRLINRIS